MSLHEIIEEALHLKPQEQYLVIENLIQNLKETSEGLHKEETKKPIFNSFLKISQEIGSLEKYSRDDLHER